MRKTENSSIRLYLTMILLFMSFHTYSQYDSIPFDGYNRTYLVHLPAGYSENSELPLLIALHGGFGNAFNMQNQSQLSVKADTENFIVVYPEGVKGGLLNISSWNAGWCCGFASNSNVDDVGFISALLDTLIEKYSIDTKRIYATGMSNGGFMAYRLACELSHRIAAIAPVAASMSMTSCMPQRPVAVIGFHSYLDTNVPHEGGLGSGVSNHYNSPQDSVFNAWAAMNECLVLNDTIHNDAQYTGVRWTNCSCGVEIQYFITQDGGHSWPGGNQSLIGDPASNYISANDKMWDFFQQHSMDCHDVSSVDDMRNQNIIRVFPNPATGTIYFETHIHWKNLQITIFDTQGKKLSEISAQTEIDISSFPAGLLLIKIKMDGRTETHKIMKYP